MLEVFPALRGLTPGMHRRLVSEAVSRTIAEHSVLFDEGSACGLFPLLLAGSMKVVKCAPNGREILLYRKSPGEVCPISTGCILGKSSYPARGVSTGGLEMVGLPASLFEMLLADHAPFRRMVFSEFSHRLAEMMELVEEIAFSRVDQRLAKMLLEQGDLSLSHQQIAEELGSVREVISRTLRQMEMLHIVHLGREHVTILDRRALQNLVESGLYGR